MSTDALEFLAPRDVHYLHRCEAPGELDDAALDALTIEELADDQ